MRDIRWPEPRTTIDGTASSVERFRPRRTVSVARARDAVILRDGATERFHTLGPVAADIWDHLVAGLPAPDIVTRLAKEYDAPRDRIAADVAAQIARLRRAGLIEPRVASVADAPPLRMPSYARCALALTAVKLRLALQGYERTLTWLRRRVGAVPATEQADLPAVQAAEYRVALVAALYPGRAQCLERSLALYLLLRRQSVAIRYCQGVQPYPFQAHAWLEYRGVVLNDVPEHAHQYARFPEQLP